MRQGKTALAVRPRPAPLRLLAMTLVLILVLVGAGGLFWWWRDGQTVAIVNGERITRAQLFDAMYARVGQEVVEDLIGRQLVGQAARRAGVTVDEAQFQEYMQEIIDRFGGEDGFAAALLYYGLTREAVEQDIRSQLLAENTVVAGLTFSEAELRDFFEANRDFFGAPEQVRASHILLDTEEEASEALRRLQAGDDFSALAAELSRDSMTAGEGGDLGFFTREEMVHEFSEAVFTLEIGQLSEVVESSYGYHVILVTGRQPAWAPAFEEVRDEVRKQLRTARAEELLPGWMQELRAWAHVEYRLPDRQ